jgi:leucyl aminopeptidase
MSGEFTTTITASLQGVAARSVAVLIYFEDDDLSDMAEISTGAGQALQNAISRGEVKSKLFSLTLLHGGEEFPAVACIGAGRRDGADNLTVMRVAAAAVSSLLSRAYTDIAFLDRGLGTPFDFSRAVVEGSIRGAYDPGIRKSRGERRASLANLTIVSSRSEDDLRAGSHQGEVVGEASSIARDLVNMPPNELTPAAFGDRARELAESHGLGCEILDEHAIAERSMGVILGVAGGSAQPPRVIVLRYGNPDSPVKLALVGKGITFDSGGLSLKTADGMMTMKGDMGGAAAVVAAMVAVARLRIDGISITGYVGATENMPGGAAMRPGDVLTAVNGETIEVLNTDAEGRLVLADLLAHAVEQGATHIVDVATLTGGAVVALGSVATLAAGKPMEWVHRVVAAADVGLERAWPMPIFDEYRQAMDSEIADIKNVGGRGASPLTASAFLADFVGDVPWTHLDVAGTAWSDTALPYLAKGGTGAGVATLVQVASKLNK